MVAEAAAVGVAAEAGAVAAGVGRVGIAGEAKRTTGQS